jgi:PAS domain S-box-containing protein
MTSYNVAELAQTLFEEEGDALFLFDPDNERLLDVNPMAQRLTGFARGDLLRMQVTYLFRAEAQGGLQRLRAAFHKTGLFHSQEGFLLRHQDEGVWVPVNLTITRLHAEPRTLGLITARDISERRRFEKELQESRALFQRQFTQLEDIYRHTPVGLAFLDRELRIVRINDWLAALNGRPAAEHIGRRLRDILPADMAADLEAVLRPVIERGVAVENLVSRRPLPTNPQETRDWLENYFPHRLPGGGVGGVYCVVADVTERRRAEEALRASEAKYRTVVENLDQSIFLKDANLRFVAANPSFCRSLGRTEDEVVGKTDLDFYPRHLAEKYRADDHVVLTEGRHLSLEEENV